VDREIAAGPYELVNEHRLGDKLAISVNVEDGLFVQVELMANEICLRIRKIISPVNAD
jgi:hypothetical protein